MKSPVAKNGDTIEQFELEAVIGSDLARTAMLVSLCRRIAAGARVERGRLDVEITDLAPGGKMNLEDVLEYARLGGFDCPNWIEIGSAKSVASSEKSKREYRNAKSV